jgi:hypothetical protein
MGGLSRISIGASVASARTTSARAARSVMAASALVARAALAALRWLAGPGFLAFAFFMIGCGLAVGGVYVLWGLGWALLSGAVPFLAAAAILCIGDQATTRGTDHG